MMARSSQKQDAAIGDLFGERQAGGPVCVSTKAKAKPASLGRPLRPGRDESSYLTVAAVAHRFGVSRATIWRWAKGNHHFPKPVKLSPGTSRWLEADLVAFQVQASYPDPKIRRDKQRMTKASLR
jgi:predicted DNA-binding transcriptional regulator AlpA